MTSFSIDLNYADTVSGEFEKTVQLLLNLKERLNDVNKRTSYSKNSLTKCLNDLSNRKEAVLRLKDELNDIIILYDKAEKEVAGYGVMNDPAISIQLLELLKNNPSRLPDELKTIDSDTILGNYWSIISEFVGGKTQSYLDTVLSA